MGPLNYHTGIIMESEGNHISILKGSHQNLDRITEGLNLSYSRIGKKELSHIKDSQKSFQSHSQTVYKKSLSHPIFWVPVPTINTERPFM